MRDGFKNMRPLTNRMTDILMDCHERELMNLPPNRATMRYAAGLLKRKLLMSQVYKDSRGKNIICLYTTQAGRDYLDKIK